MDGFEGNFWDEGLPLCVQSKFECLHGRSGHNILWQLVPVWDYSDAERMVATTSLTPLSVILQSMTSTTNAGGGSEYRVTWKVEETEHFGTVLQSHSESSRLTPRLLIVRTSIDCMFLCVIAKLCREFDCEDNLCSCSRLRPGVMLLVLFAV